MRGTFNNREVKQVNKERVFRCILGRERIAVQEIASTLTLSTPTVQQCVNELIETGLIREAGLLESTGGRKAKSVMAASYVGWTVGIDITKNHIGLVVLDMKGMLLCHERVSCAFSYEEKYFKELGRKVEAVVKRATKACEGAGERNESVLNQEVVVGVGMSIPGIVDQSGERIETTDVLMLKDISCHEFSRFIPYPCMYMNDANAAGWAEYEARAEREDAFYFSLSNSVGGAILHKEGLLEGNHIRGGEVGHMTYIPGGELCYCGKRGCFDTYLSAKVLEREGKCKLSEFFDKLEAGDSPCKKIWEEYLECLAVAVNNIRMILDCNVILGGYVGCYMGAHVDYLKEKVAMRNTFETNAEYVETCTYQIEAAAVGAALRQRELFIESVCKGCR